MPLGRVSAPYEAVAYGDECRVDIGGVGSDVGKCGIRGGVGVGHGVGGADGFWRCSGECPRVIVDRDDDARSK